MAIDQQASLRLVGEALSIAHCLGDVDQITVRSVKIVDQSLTVEALAVSDDPILLRGQAASVMGGLSGLDPADLFPALSFTTFAVRLVTQRGDHVLWVISSPQDAKFAENGVVRWLANSLVQDNTPAYRRSQVDRLIAQLEIGLRDVLHLHWCTAHGEGYASRVLAKSVLGDLRKMARKEGEDDQDDRTLLDFTGLPQLAGSVCSEPLLVEHGCIADPEQLKHDLAELNKVRRKLAHNRVLTGDDVDKARSIVAGILQTVGEHHPELTEDFLSERWDDVIEDLMKSLSAGMRTEDPPAVGTIPESERRTIAAEMVEKQLAATKSGLIALGNVVVPATRRTVHDLVDQALRQLAGSLDDLAKVASRDDLILVEAKAAHDRHASALSRIRKLGEEIKRIRVLEHAVR